MSNPFIPFCPVPQLLLRVPPGLVHQPSNGFPCLLSVPLLESVNHPATESSFEDTNHISFLLLWLFVACIITKFKFLHMVSTISLQESHVLVTLGYFLFSKEALHYVVPFFMLFPLLGRVFFYLFPLGKSYSFHHHSQKELILPASGLLTALFVHTFFAVLIILLYTYYFMYLSPMLGHEVFEGREYVLLIFFIRI